MGGVDFCWAGAALQGEYLLQGAAGSTLGKMLIQYCKTKGIKTINVVRRQAQVQELEDLGCRPAPRPLLYTPLPRHDCDITCSARPRPTAQLPGLPVLQKVCLHSCLV